MMSLSSATAHADPPRPDALKMRNAPRASAAAVKPAEPSPAPAQPTPAQPVGAQPATAARVDSATTTKAVKEASDALELCHGLARRADTTLAAQVTVQATVRADASVELRAEISSLGNGYFARCVERKLGSLVAVGQLPAPAADTRTIVIGAKAAR
jgi:hypothetical protein